MRDINLDWHQNVKVDHPTLNIVPGKKLCCNFRNKIQGLLIISINASASSGSEAEVIQATSSQDDSHASLKETLSGIGKSPVKLHNIPALSKFTYGKRKLTQINSTVKQKFGKVLCLPELPTERDQKAFENMQNLENPSLISWFCSDIAVYSSLHTQSTSRFCSR